MVRFQGSNHTVPDMLRNERRRRDSRDLRDGHAAQPAKGTDPTYASAVGTAGAQPSSVGAGAGAVATAATKKHAGRVGRRGSRTALAQQPPASVQDPPPQPPPAHAQTLQQPSHHQGTSSQQQHQQQQQQHTCASYETLAKLSDDQFADTMRMSRESFDTLLELISSHPVFDVCSSDSKAGNAHNAPSAASNANAHYAHQQHLAYTHHANQHHNYGHNAHAHHIPNLHGYTSSTLSNAAVTAIIASGATAASLGNMSIADQLVITLERFGTCGKEARIQLLIKKHQVGVEALTRITERVTIAIIESLQIEHLSWPLAKRKDEIKKGLAEIAAFQDCVGCLGTTLFHTYVPPSLEGYKGTRAGKFGISGLLVCDDEGRIQYAQIGAPIDQSKANLLAQSQLMKEAKSFFEGGEYVLADAEFPALVHVVPAFPRVSNKASLSEPAAAISANASRLDDDDGPSPDDQLRPQDSQQKPHQLLPPVAAQFNAKWVDVYDVFETCVSTLKGRFRSLTDLHINIQTTSNVEFASQWVLACCALHNFLLAVGDTASFDWTLGSDSETPQLDRAFGESTATLVDGMDDLGLEDTNDAASSHGSRRGSLRTQGGADGEAACARSSSPRRQPGEAEHATAKTFDKAGNVIEHDDEGLKKRRKVLRKLLGLARNAPVPI